MIEKLLDKYCAKKLFKKLYSEIALIRNLKLYIKPKNNCIRLYANYNGPKAFEIDRLVYVWPINSSLYHLINYKEFKKDVLGYIADFVPENKEV